MSFIPREIESRINRFFLPNKVLVILGARRIGKTLFLREFVKDLDSSILQLNGEDLSTHDILKTRSVENYKRILGKNKVLIIDEAQKIPDIGGVLKLMVDEIPGIRIVASGSSMFDLNNQLGEPLTGRKFTFLMFPFAQMEYNQIENPIQTYSNLEERLIYGSYPRIINLGDNQLRQLELRELVNSYLFQDILQLDGLKNSKKLYQLLKLLAFQLGSEVSHLELGQQLGMDKATVAKYLELLEKTFVIFERTSFSRNPRKEISKGKKYYFYDLGVRNIIVDDLKPLSMRDPREIGHLWENYILVERLKYHEYSKLISGVEPRSYFWRTYEQQEIDLIEEINGNLYAYEIKFKTRSKWKPSLTWLKDYPQARNLQIDSSNYLSFIGAAGNNETTNR
jgi:predicted AAA+ superfamily ATPase